MGLLSCIAIGTSSPIPVLHILIQHHLPLLYLLILLFLKCMSNQCLEPSVHDLWNASHNLLPRALFYVKISEKKCGLLVYSLVNGHWLSNSTIHALGYIDLINIFYYHIVCFDQFGFLLLLQLSWTTKIRPKTLDWGTNFNFELGSYIFCWQTAAREHNFFRKDFRSKFNYQDNEN